MSKLVEDNSALFAAIREGGYHPQVIADSARDILAGETALSFVVHHEPTFDREEVRRHMTVLLLTDSRIIVLHTDEHPPDDIMTTSYTSTTSESVGLSKVRSVVTTRIVADGESQAAEAMLTIGWGAISRIDVEPARCPDPECDADHGYTGSLTGDDFTLRLSAAADGVAAVSRLLEFGRQLTRLTSGNDR